jgi:multiple sugar transport system substrate-binding protein
MIEKKDRKVSRRDFLRVAAATTAGSVLVACAPKATEAPKPTEAPSTGGAAPSAAGEKSVRLGVWASPEEFNFFQEWVKPYQESSGTKVNIEYVDWTTYWTKLPTQFSAGTAADVLEMSNFTLQFGPQNVLADLNSFFDTSGLKKDDFVAVPFEKFTYEGKLISFPLGLTIQMLAYNKDIFDKAGEPYPDNTWDWAKMREVAMKFTKDKNGKGPADADFDVANVTQWGIEMQLDEESGWAPLVFQNEADYWKDNYTTANFTDPKVVEAFQFLTDLINVDKCAPSPAAQQKFSGSAFQAGQAAMSRQGTYMLLTYITNIKSFKWDVAVPPKGKTRGVFADGIGWSMSNGTKIKDDAFALIKWLNTDGQKYMAEKHWQVPILKSAYEFFASPPPDHAKDLKEQFDYGHRWPAYKNQQQVDDFIGQKTTEIFDGKAKPADALKEIQDYVDPLVK